MTSESLWGSWQNCPDEFSPAAANLWHTHRSRLLVSLKVLNGLLSLVLCNHSYPLRYSNATQTAWIMHTGERVEYILVRQLQGEIGPQEPLAF